MSKGYPDFFGFSFFPYHGSTFVVELDDTVANGNTVDVLDLALKGILRRGHLDVVFVAFTDEVLIRVFVDGNAVELIASLDVLDVNLASGKSDIFTLKRVSAELLYMSWELVGEFSFQDSMKITVQNNSIANNVFIESRFHYNKIQT